MEHIEKTVHELLRGDKLSRLNQPGAVSLLRKPASPEEIAVIVTRLELLKQIKPLDDFQRAALIERLYDLGETKEQIQRRADSVALKETYGTIAFQYWVEELVCLYSETAERRNREYQLSRQKIDEEIRRRIDRLKTLSFEAQREVDEETADLRGLEDARRDWHMKLMEIRERARQQYARRFAFARKVLGGLDREGRIKVLEAAKEQKIIQSYDEMMIENIHLFPDRFYRVVEEFAREGTVNG